MMHSTISATRVVLLVMRTGTRDGSRKRPKVVVESDDDTQALDHEPSHAHVAMAQIEQGLLCGICIELYDRPCVYVL